MSRQDHRVASRAWVFLWSALYGLLVGVAAVVPMITAISLYLIYGPHPASDHVFGSARLVALMGGAIGMIGGCVVGKYRTEQGTAGLPVGPLLLRVATWAAVAAACAVGALTWALVSEAQRFGILHALVIATGAATVVGGLAAILCIGMASEDAGMKTQPTGAHAATEGFGPPTPPDAEAIQPPGGIRERTTR